MKILFDQQDMIDSICVLVAAEYNDGDVEGSEPNLVKHTDLFHDGNVFIAKAYIHGTAHILDQQKIVDAVSLYLSAYYSFAVDRLAINLQYDEVTKGFGAEIIVQR